MQDSEGNKERDYGSGPIVVLGAGPAGLSAAFGLRETGKRVIVVEKNPRVGGLSRTLRFGEFLTDIGPHRFFSKNRRINAFVKGLMGEQWLTVNRLTRFYVKGKLFLYPVEWKNALCNLGVLGSTRILTDYLVERVKGVLGRSAATAGERNFEEEAVARFGRALAEMNMLNYTEKVWGMPCKELSADWLTQRVRGLSLLELVKKAFSRNRTTPKTLVDRFHYPVGGAGSLYERMREKMEEGGNVEFIFNATPVCVEHKEGRVVRVVIEGTGNCVEVKEPAAVISSIPVTELIEILKPSPPPTTIDHATKLKFRSHVSLFMTIAKESLFPDQWLYFPDKSVPFGRITEPRNFSHHMSPAGKTSLLVEFFCWFGDDIWHADEEYLMERSIPILEGMGMLGKDEVIESFVHRERYAYPVYDLPYRKNLEPVCGYLSSLQNLFLVGRAGCFRYNNQDHAMEMGFRAAEAIIGRREETGMVGDEDEYFEDGTIDDEDR